MEQFEDLRRHRTALGIVSFIVTTIILTIVDFLCVGAYLSIILCLLYFTFLKDCLEILVYANVKFVTRLKWLYGIFKIRELLYVDPEIREHEPTTASIHLNNSVSVQSDTSVKTSPDPVASTSGISKSTCDPLITTYEPLSVQSTNSLQSVVFGEIGTPTFCRSPQSRESGSEKVAPRKLSSLSTHAISSTDNFNIDGTNFEDIDLTQEDDESDLKSSPREESNFKQSSAKWNVSNMKFFDSLRKTKFPSPDNIKMQLGNIASKVTKALPHRADDKEKLVKGQDDSPGQIGCCTSLPHLFKAKYQSSIASYEQF